MYVLRNITLMLAGVFAVAFSAQAQQTSPLWTRCPGDVQYVQDHGETLILTGYVGLGFLPVYGNCSSQLVVSEDGSFEVVLMMAPLSALPGLGIQPELFLPGTPITIRYKGAYAFTTRRGVDVYSAIPFEITTSFGYWRA